MSTKAAPRTRPLWATLVATFLAQAAYAPAPAHGDRYPRLSYGGFWPDRSRPLYRFLWPACWRLPSLP